MGLILDTSVLIAAERQRLDLTALFATFRGDIFGIAAITASELLHGVERAKPAARKDARSQFVEKVLAQIETIDFDLSVARRHAELWASAEAAGKSIGPYDLLIAATAIHYDYRLATLNAAEFRQVRGLHLVDLARFILPEASK